jgi:ComF family protein
MRFIERPFCERLGTPFDIDLGQSGLLSPDAIANPPVFSRARSVVRFDDGPARLIVHRLKYYDRLEIARPVGRWMARAGAELLDEADVLAPVPMHRLRLVSRRHNQAAVLAQAISRDTGVPTAMRALERVKPTPPQVGLSRAQRAANMQGAFRASEEGKLAALDRRVVLVDDVMTSGATVNAAARALLRAGAKRVDVLTFARVVTGG